MDFRSLQDGVVLEIQKRFELKQLSCCGFFNYVLKTILLNKGGDVD